MQTKQRITIYQATFLVLLAFSCFANCARAETTSAQSIASLLRNSNLLPTQDPLKVLYIDDKLTIVLSDEHNNSDDDLRKTVISVIKAIKPVRDSKPSKISIIFAGPKSNESSPARQITLDQKDIANVGSAIESGAAESVETLKQTPITIGQIVESSGFSSGAKHSAASSELQISKNVDARDTEFSKQYLSLRKKVGSRLSALQARGAGVKPYQSSLSGIDQLYKQDDFKGAFAGLAGLEDAIGDQEARFFATHGKVAAAPVASQSGLSSITPGEVPLGALSRDDYYNRMVQNILAKELGGDAPADGPFQLERFRAAKCIHQYASQGKDMSGPHYLFKQIEALVISKDSSKIPEIVDKLNYLQKQLGLPPLQTTKKPGQR
jgi:hypothetical protein